MHPTKSYFHSRPVKMYEYMAVSFPVIASNFPSWRNIIEEHQCGICVDPYDYEEAAKAIGWLVDHPEEAMEMGKRGRLAVERYYNWGNEEKQLLSLYEEYFSQKRCCGSSISIGEKKCR